MLAGGGHTSRRAEQQCGERDDKVAPVPHEERPVQLHGTSATHIHTAQGSSTHENRVREEVADDERGVPELVRDHRVVVRDPRRRAAVISPVVDEHLDAHIDVGAEHEGPAYRERSPATGPQGTYPMENMTKM
jgi:hypothetical protein